MGHILCFKHRRRVARDNAVKYYRHTLQLLPSQQRRSYAGAVIVVPEGLDGRLALQHEGRIIAFQEAPPSPASLRSRNETSPSCHHPDSPVRVKAFGCSSRSAERKAGSRRRCSRGSNRRSGRSRVAGRRIAAEADVPAAGEMEGGAAGQASGDVHSTDGEGVGNPQRHGEEIHRRRDSVDVANPGNSSGTSI